MASFLVQNGSTAPRRKVSVLAPHLVKALEVYGEDGGRRLNSLPLGGDRALIVVLVPAELAPGGEQGVVTLAVEDFGLQTKNASLFPQPFLLFVPSLSW